MKKPAGTKPPAGHRSPLPPGKAASKHTAKTAPAQHVKPKPFKPVPVSVQRKRHQAAVKAAHARAKRKQPKPPAKRGLAIGHLAECCVAEAVAASLRLTGHPVTDADVLQLHTRIAAPDERVTIEAILAAAQTWGLAGARPVGWAPAAERLFATITPLAGAHALILGVDLPGAHTVCAVPDGWWTWGELHTADEWPHVVIDEAWAVTW